MHALLRLALQYSDNNWFGCCWEHLRSWNGYHARISSQHGCNPIQSIWHKDTDRQGAVVEKTAGMSQEHMQRAKCMNHQFVCEQRNEEKRKQSQATLRKMKEANAKYEQKIEANRDAVWKLLKQAESDRFLYQDACLLDERNLECCTLDTFDCLKLAELKAFIVAHDDTLMRMKDIPTVVH